MVLVQQLGAPIPATPVLLLAGAHAAADPLYGVYALALAILASSAGSLPWFWAGRRYGYRVLKFMCRVSLSPDGCVRQTETAFERHGAAALLIAKFVPGLARVAPPVAGAFHFSTSRFLLYYGAGNALWAGTGLILGLAFHAEIEWLVARLAALGWQAAAVILAVVAVYIAYRWLVRRQFLKTLRASRIGVAELQEIIGRGDAPIVLDARSRTQRKLDRRTIPGARLVDLDDLEGPLPHIPAEGNMVVYCACPNDATALKVAMLLRRRGIRRVRALVGGIDAWTAAGLMTTDAAANGHLSSPV